MSKFNYFFFFLKKYIYIIYIQDLTELRVNYETDISNVTAAPEYTEKVGSPFRLHVLVSPKNGATGDISYQWYKDNNAQSAIPVAITGSGGRTAVLRIDPVKIGDEGSYFCVTRLQDSIRKSTPVNLLVNCKNFSFCFCVHIGVARYSANFVWEYILNIF